MSAHPARSKPSYSNLPTTELRPITVTSAALATLCAVLWGGLAVAIKYTQDSLPPIGTAGMRFAIASVLVYAWGRTQGQPLIVRVGQKQPVIMLGLLLFVQIGLFHWGLDGTNSAHGSVLIGSHPVFVALVAHFALRGDRLSWNKLAGLLLAVLGLVAVVGGQQNENAQSSSRDVATFWGDGIVLASSFLLAVKTVYTKIALAKAEVAKLLLWSNLLATFLFMAYSLVFEGVASYHFTLAAILGLAYQGLVVAGFCFLMWTALLRWHRASELAVFTFFQPLCGMIFGVVLRGDHFSSWLAAGGLAVAAGIYLVTRSGR